MKKLLVTVILMGFVVPQARAQEEGFGDPNVCVLEVSHLRERVEEIEQISHAKASISHKGQPHSHSLEEALPAACMSLGIALGISGKGKAMKLAAVLVTGGGLFWLIAHGIYSQVVEPLADPMVVKADDFDSPYKGNVFALFKEHTDAEICDMHRRSAIIKNETASLKRSFQKLDELVASHAHVVCEQPMSYHLHKTEEELKSSRFMNSSANLDAELLETSARQAESSL